MKLILISGKMRHGKDTTANFMKEELEKKNKRVIIIHYGDYLKFILKEYYGWNGQKDEDGRQLLQHFASDIVRKNYPDFWVDTVNNFLLAVQDMWDFAIIPDVRFQNEIVKTSRVFGVQNVEAVRVERPGFIPPEATQEQLNHISETELDDFLFKTVFCNKGSLDILRAQVKDFLNKTYLLDTPYLS